MCIINFLTCTTLFILSSLTWVDNCSKINFCLSMMLVWFTKARYIESLEGGWRLLRLKRLPPFWKNIDYQIQFHEFYVKLSSDFTEKNYKHNHTLHFSKWASHSISNLVLTSSICCSKYINLDWTELNFFWLKGSRARAFSSLWYLGSLLRTSLDLASSAHSNVSTVLPCNFLKIDKTFHEKKNPIILFY